MKNHTDRTLCALLLAALITSAAAGCSGGETKPQETSGQAAAAGTETSATETTTTELQDNIGKYDFKGAKFSIVLSDEQLGPTWPYHTEEQNGDLLNDAVFSRDAKVKERFNADITYFDTKGTGGQPVAAMKASVLAGDGAYHLCINHMYGGFNGAITDGILYDFNKLPVIDLDRPWWNPSIRENLEVEGVLLTAVSDIIYNYVDIVYFNKKLMDDFKIEYPYAKVYDGTWTWDYLAKITKGVTTDLNGDGKLDENDRWGMVIDQNLSSMTRLIHSCGMTMATFDKDGKPTLTGMMSDKMQSALEKYYNLVCEDDRSFRCLNVNDHCVMFNAGQAMAMHTQTTKLTQLRDMEQEFGVAPLPKYDEKQDGYHTLASTQMLLLPADMKDPEFVGVMTEAMSAESYKQITPVLFDVVFESKYLRDEDSFKMYKLMRDSLVYDFNWNYGSGNAMAYLVGRTVGAATPTKDLSSFYAANVESCQKILDKVYEDVVKNYVGK